jgi:DNA repair protein SbcC/Rad50
MRPLKLTMQAFGPYAETEVIDFTSLGNRTMFVISGKTGSGKTTIFDGISYAIYGKASGEDRNGPDLRSQFAKSETATEVALEFALRSKTYYIIRSPQQEKQKERGDGVRIIGAKAELYEIKSDGTRQLLASNVREVDEKIKEIMIIDSNQFRQILMIPQGEFRKLLTSESKDKELILQRLFHTQIYKRIEEELKENAGELKKAVESQTEQRGHALKQIHALFQEELKEYIEAGNENDTVILPLLSQEIDLMNAELGKLADQLKLEKENRDRIQQKLYKAETIVKQLKAKADLAARKSELEMMGEQFNTVEKQIEFAHKAALLAQQEELCHHLKKEVDQTNQSLEKIKLNMTALSTLLKENEAKWEAEKDKEEDRKRIANRISTLQNMKEDVYLLSEVQEEAGKLKAEIQKKKSVNEQLQISIQEKAEIISSLKMEKEEAEQAKLSYFENSHKLEKAEDEIVRLKRLAEQNLRYQQALKIFKQRQGLLTQVSASLADAKSLVAEMEQKWLHGQASILAKQLHEGEPCPVCGSNHHPKPATTDEGIPTEKDLKAAKLQAAALEKEKAAAESSFYEAQSSVHSLSEAIKEQLLDLRKQYAEFNMEALPEWQEKKVLERNSLIQAQKEASAKQERFALCVKELEETEKQKENELNQQQKLIEQLNDLTILYTGKMTNLNRMMEKVPEELRSVHMYERKCKDAAQRQEELMKRLEEAQQRYLDSKDKLITESAKFETIQEHAVKFAEKLKYEREAFIQKMHQQGFEVYGQYNEAKRSEQEIKSLEESLRSYREELRSVRDQLEELNRLLIDIEKPDMDKLNNDFQMAENQIRLLQEQYTNLYIQKRDNEDTLDRVAKINHEIKALEERYKIVGHLADISKGQNTNRITFERFVLAAFLDDILRTANVRLRKMTSGRFELKRKKDRSKGNVQSGLELLVFDQYTGQERHVKTLSGGESFKAALALALGLADVVQQYAGGVSLETMFIDEGFGTLDPESLDQAIEALIDIQSSGRLVGIISHVPELKERIDARLEVTATQRGSKTEFQFLS